jgi:TRAP-type C4-dicarboxylate transport system permease small subunit
VAAEDFLRTATIITMTALVVIQVILRVLFHWGSPVWEEMARFFLIWSIMVGALVTTREDEHIKMDILEHYVRSPKTRLSFEVVMKFICFLFLCVFTWWSWRFLLWSVRVNQQSFVLEIPMYTVHSAFAICGFFATLHFLIHFIKKTNQLINFKEKGRDRC